MAALKKQFFCLYLIIGLILPLQYSGNFEVLIAYWLFAIKIILIKIVASCIGSTSSPEPLKTLSPGCNLNCGSYGFLSNYNGQCDCICYEFHYYNGVNCVLSN
jgi:hypothetical protein